MNNNVTQYQRILQALHQAGRKGATTLELIVAAGTTCPHKRIAEMPIWHMIGGKRHYIDRSIRLINSRHVRVYRLVKV
jgi:hypothetical protein